MKSQPSRFTDFPSPLNAGCDTDRRKFLGIALAAGALALSGPAALVAGSASADDAAAQRLGGTFRLGGDLTVNRLGFGAMRLPSSAGMAGPPRDPEASRAVLRRVIELGINHIDTANFYGNADGSIHANTLIRETLHPYPADLVIATKVGPLIDTRGRPQTPMYGPPSGLRAQVEANLETLGLDRLDLVYLRVGGAAPTEAPIAGHFEALARLREEGLIRHLGLSNINAGHFAEARVIAPVAAVENRFNIIQRDHLDLLELCTAEGIAFVPFGLLGSGGRDDLNTDRMKRVAARHQATVYQIALAWLLARSPVALAIPGTGSVSHLEENVAAASIHLSKADLEELA